MIDPLEIVVAIIDGLVNELVTVNVPVVMLEDTKLGMYDINDVLVISIAPVVIAVAIKLGVCSELVNTMDSDDIVVAIIEGV
jgi:ActR/RegA family two-component response regulator